MPRLSEARYGRSRLSEAIGRSSRLSEARYGRSRLSEAIGRSSRLSEAMWGRSRLSEAGGRSSRLSEAMWGRSRLSEAGGRSPGLARQWLVAPSLARLNWLPSTLDKARNDGCHEASQSTPRSAQRAIPLRCIGVPAR
jgi:hypothetical protein